MMNEVLKTIARRRSCRQFLPKQIDDLALKSIITAGLQAPSGHNDQSWYWVVVQNQELIKELSEGSKQEMQKVPVEWIANAGKVEQYNIYYHAPTVIVLCARKDAVSPIPDVCAAIENMMLAALSQGISSCWIGFTSFYFNSEERYKKVGVPEGYEVHYGLSLGLAADVTPRQPPIPKYEQYFHIIK